MRRSREVKDQGWLDQTQSTIMIFYPLQGLKSTTLEQSVQLETEKRKKKFELLI